VVSAADLLAEGAEPRSLDFLTGTEKIGDDALSALHESKEVLHLCRKLQTARTPGGAATRRPWRVA